jgi:hypothetical protein
MINAQGPSNQVEILHETFETDFPKGWEVNDSGAGSNEYFWGQRNCRSSTGNHSGWAVGAGKDGSLLGCGADYPNDVKAWMTYGPFSLTDASSAEMTFQLWLNTEKDYDKVFYGASKDGVHFSGFSVSGDSQGWIARRLDLSNAGNLGNLMGEKRVWIAIVFSSDDSLTYAEGAHVDEIVVKKSVGALTQFSIPQSQSQSGAQPHDTMNEAPTILTMPVQMPGGSHP